MEEKKIVVIELSGDELKKLISEAVSVALSKKSEKELLSFKETCEYLSCSASSLNKWMRLNLIPYHKLGNRNYFKIKEVIEALKEGGIYNKLKELK